MLPLKKMFSQCHSNYPRRHPDIRSQSFLKLLILYQALVEHREVKRRSKNVEGLTSPRELLGNSDVWDSVSFRQLVHPTI